MIRYGLMSCLFALTATTALMAQTQDRGAFMVAVALDYCVPQVLGKSPTLPTGFQRAEHDTYLHANMILIRESATSTGQRHCSLSDYRSNLTKAEHASFLRTLDRVVPAQTDPAYRTDSVAMFLSEKARSAARRFSAPVRGGFLILLATQNQSTEGPVAGAVSLGVGLYDKR